MLLTLQQSKACACEDCHAKGEPSRAAPAAKVELRVAGNCQPALSDNYECASTSHVHVIPAARFFSCTESVDRLARTFKLLWQARATVSDARAGKHSRSGEPGP